MASRQLAQLQLVCKLAKKKEDDAAKHLYSVKQQLMDEEKRLQMLLRYQQEYQEKATQRSQQIMTGALYHNQQAFIKNIHHAIANQHQQIDKCKLIVSKQTQVWYSLKSRAEALEDLVKAAQKKQEKQEDKREQQFQDELEQNKRSAPK